VFDLDALNAALAGTIFHGKLHHFGSINSTNTYALEQARKGAPQGSCYFSDEQTAGRGRSDHIWHSAAAQGLYLSVLIRPQIPVTQLTWLPLLAGLATHRAITEVTALTADLRWPNDILISGRKVAGILVEAQTDADTATAAVIGIGINVHQKNFPPEVSTPATSLDLETGRYNGRQELLIALLQSLQSELEVLGEPSVRDQSFAGIPARIAAVSTWVQGRKVEVHGPQPCTGVTAGLDASGFLRVTTPEGQLTITTGGIRAA